MLKKKQYKILSKFSNLTRKSSFYKCTNRIEEIYTGISHNKIQQKFCEKVRRIQCSLFIFVNENLL